jgi:hypothetical protein
MKVCVNSGIEPYTYNYMMSNLYRYLSILKRTAVVNITVGTTRLAWTLRLGVETNGIPIGKVITIARTMEELPSTWWRLHRSGSRIVWRAAVSTRL